MSIVNNLFWKLVDKPDIPEVYRNLRDYYVSLGMNNEALAIGLLVELRSHADRPNTP